MMCCCHHQFFNIVIIQCLHSLDSSAASVLAAEVIYCHTFDITKFCHGNDSIFSRDHIFHRNIKRIKSDSCSSVIAVFLRNRKDFLTNNTKKCISVCKDCFQFADLFH